MNSHQNKFFENSMFRNMIEAFERAKVIVRNNEDVDYLLSFKSNFEDMMNESMQETCGVMTTKINNLQRTKDFNIDLVQTLPSDVIDLIKEFMMDDIEFVRRAYIIYNTQPYFGFIDVSSFGVCRKIIERMVKKIKVKKT